MPGRVYVAVLGGEPWAMAGWFGAPMSMLSSAPQSSQRCGSSTDGGCGAWDGSARSILVTPGSGRLTILRPVPAPQSRC